MPQRNYGAPPAPFPKGARPFFLIPIACFIGLFVVFGLGLRKDPAILPSALIDKPAPSFDLPPLLKDRPGLAQADLTGRTAIDFGLYGVPETYIVDAKGAIRYRLPGALTPENLQSDILPRLAALQRQP